MAEAPNEGPNSERLLLGILAMLIAEREEREAEPADRRKTEVILDAAGLGVPTIAKLLAKKPGAVRKTIQRAR